MKNKIITRLLKHGPKNACLLPDTHCCIKQSTYKIGVYCAAVGKYFTPYLLLAVSRSLHGKIQKSNPG